MKLVAVGFIALFAGSCSPTHPTKQIVARCLLQAANRYQNDGSDVDLVSAYMTICMQAQGYQPIRTGKQCGASDASIDHACYRRAP